MDDEPDLLDLLQYNLEREGYRVLLARDGSQGLETAEREAPDAIILDVMMPGLDGLQVVGRLRQNASLRTTSTSALLRSRSSRRGTPNISRSVAK